MTQSMAQFSIMKEDRGRFYLTYSEVLQFNCDMQPFNIIISQSFSNRSSLEQFLGYMRETTLIALLSAEGELPNFRLRDENGQWVFELRDHLNHIVFTSVPFYDREHCLEALESFKHNAGTAKIFDYV